MRALLVLGRVSNLPTVWSNCAAAWLLGGGGSTKRFLFLLLGASLLYTGGMFLNDAVDVEFDRRYRPERPVPSGQISARAVWMISVILLLAGWIGIAPLGRTPALLATALLLAIALYDVVHKRTRVAPLLMAGCRFLLYLVAGSSAGGDVNSPVFWRALGLASYIVGLSYLARGESTGKRALRWTGTLLFAPIAIAFVVPVNSLSILIAPAVLLGVWIGWCLCARTPRFMRLLPKSVAGLLAGIVLVDWLAAAGRSPAIVFIGLLLLAVLFQRIAPAT